MRTFWKIPSKREIIRKQDKDILKLNLHIQEQNKFLEEMVSKQPTGKRHTLKRKLEELKRKENLTKNSK